MDKFKCEYCDWEIENKYDFLWTSPEGKRICTNCYKEHFDEVPKGLQDLNEERRIASEWHK